MFFLLSFLLLFFDKKYWQKYLCKYKHFRLIEEEKGEREKEEKEK